MNSLSDSIRCDVAMPVRCIDDKAADEKLIVLVFLEKCVIVLGRNRDSFICFRFACFARSFCDSPINGRR